MHKGIIFDMDGVLADTEGFYSRRRAEYLKAVGYSSIEQTYDFTGSNERDLWEAIVPNDHELRQELMIGYRAYRKIHPVPFSELADPDVRPLFQELKSRGMKIGIASSSDPKSIRAMTDAAGITELVDYILSGEECVAHKPSPEIYLRVLETLGLEANQTLVVEDSPIGIRAGKRANIKVLALKPKNGTNPDQSEADAVLNNLTEVLMYL